MDKKDFLNHFKNNLTVHLGSRNLVQRYILVVEIRQTVSFIPFGILDSGIYEFTNGKNTLI